MVYVAAGGFIGSLLRYLVTILLDTQHYPYATLSVNLLGSFIIGLALVAPKIHLFFTIGLVGSFTTFSTFTLETLQLIYAGRLWTAVSYYFLSVILGIILVIIGIKLAKSARNTQEGETTL